MEMKVLKCFDCIKLYFRYMNTSLFVLTLVCSVWDVFAYDTCWDGALAVDYTGTISTTLSGRTCQPWASNSPHSHLYHGGSPLFPYDGDDVAASNYCRDPDGTGGAFGTWCYTMDPSYLWDLCVIPICSNLPCVTGNIIGKTNPTSVSTSLDANAGTNYLLQDTTTYGVTCCGTIQQWRIFIRAPGTIRLQVWTLDSGSGNYVLKRENVFTYVSGQENSRHDETVLQGDRISIEEGDLIGWYTSADMVAYATGATNDNVLLTIPAPAVGDSVDFASGTAQSSRDYAIGIEVAKSLAPSFTNTLTLITILESTAVGDPVYTLTYADDDMDDVATLTLSMSPNSYFGLSGNDVVVSTALDDGVQILNFAVRDRCGETGVFILTVNITAVPVTITSLPATTNVSETVTVETLLHTLVIVTASDNYTCTIDSYLPVRPEGNPFLIKTTPTGAHGVYLAVGANIRYNAAAELNVTITCVGTNPSNTDTNILMIDVDPNSRPTFISFSNSATFSARSTPLNTIVYTATVTDVESDPITMSMTCDPALCPFDINNAAEVYATSDLTAHQTGSYVITLTADDGFNSVTSSNISLVIIDINIKTIFTNLPAPGAVNVDENEAVGTSVYQVTFVDGNGDIPNIIGVFNSTPCDAMYDIDPATGLVTTKVILDYETDTITCYLTVIAFDGYENSDPEDLVLTLVDVDEPPVMSATAFTISTEETPDNTALPDQSISAIDPDGTAVTLALNCGSDNGHLAINPTTGIVTMTTAYDLELAAVDTYSILCSIIAMDTTGATATSSLTVIITDANDENPVFVMGGYSTVIGSGHSTFGNLLAVSATDADRTSPNNDVTYSITPTTEFNIDPSGNIYNTADLSAVAAGTVYTLTVTATDGGTIPLTDTATVVITVASVLTTTTAVSSGTGSGSGSNGSSDFFASTGNIILLALACIIALMVAVALGVLLRKYCCNSAAKPELLRMNPVKNKPMLNKEPVVEKAPSARTGPRVSPSPPPPKMNNDTRALNLYNDKGEEGSKSYHRPRHIIDRYKPTLEYPFSRPSDASPTRINVFPSYTYKK